MLAPQDRSTLLESLRPPAGFSLDAGVATTYSLHLEALLTVPLAFALYDTIEDSGPVGPDDTDSPAGTGGPKVIEPIELLDAVRRYADRITVFCQAGQIAVPPTSRPVLMWLEGVVAEVTAPLGGVFHPKVWLLRFRRESDGATCLRFLCLSRNLTFDRSWDTVLRLDSRILLDGSTPAVDPAPLQAFIRSLPTWTTSAFDAARADLLHGLADDLGRAELVVPDGFRDLSFWPLGFDGSPGDPRPDGSRRSLVMSPFVVPTFLHDVRASGKDHVLIARQEELDRLPAGATDGFEDFVLDPDVDLVGPEEPSSPPTPSSGEEAGPRPTERADDPSTTLSGLHAKVLTYETERGTTVLTGSANATSAAFSKNVEMVVRLEASRRSLTIDKILGTSGEKRSESGLRALLMPWRPPDEPLEPTAEERLQDDLDRLRHDLAAVAFTAEITPNDSDTFDLHLTTTDPLPLPASMEVAASCWPVTLHEDRRLTVEPSEPVDLHFTVSLRGLTSFFALTLTGRRDGDEAEQRFAINARLVGSPDDRHTRVLADLLRDPDRFVRYLILLLGDPSEDDVLTGAGALWSQSSSSLLNGDHPVPLFEVLVRALAQRPERLDHVARLVDELLASEQGKQVLPAGFDRVWGPIWELREARR